MMISFVKNKRSKRANEFNSKMHDLMLSDGCILSSQRTGPKLARLALTTRQTRASAIGELPRIRFESVAIKQRSDFFFELKQEQELAEFGFRGGAEVADSNSIAMR
jgi:hypothetical protein